MPSFEKYVRNPAEEGATPEDPSKIEGTQSTTDGGLKAAEAKLKIRKAELEIERLSLENERLCIANDIERDNKEVRLQLIKDLQRLSLQWLIFTALVVVVLLCCGQLKDGVAIFFITSSLATVVGLWTIGLSYFFSSSKNGIWAAVRSWLASRSRRRGTRPPPAERPPWDE